MRSHKRLACVVVMLCAGTTFADATRTWKNGGTQEWHKSAAWTEGESPNSQSIATLSPEANDTIVDVHIDDTDGVAAQATFNNLDAASFSIVKKGSGRLKLHDINPLTVNSGNLVSASAITFLNEPNGGSASSTITSTFGVAAGQSTVGQLTIQNELKINTSGADFTWVISSGNANGAVNFQNGSDFYVGSPSNDLGTFIYQSGKLNFQDGSSYLGEMSHHNLTLDNNAQLTFGNVTISQNWPTINVTGGSSLYFNHAASLTNTIQQINIGGTGNGLVQVNGNGADDLSQLTNVTVQLNAGGSLILNNAGQAEFFGIILNGGAIGSNSGGEIWIYGGLKWTGAREVTLAGNNKFRLMNDLENQNVNNGSYIGGNFIFNATGTGQKVIQGQLYVKDNTGSPLTYIFNTDAGATVTLTGGINVNAAGDFAGVTKQGDGVLQLNSNLAGDGIGQTQHWSITGGTLELNGDASAANGDITVTAGALAGTGTSGLAVIVESGGTIAPGNSIGTLTLLGGLTLNAGAIVDIQLNATDSDLIELAGSALDLGGATLNFDLLALPAADSYTFIGNYGALTGAFAGLANGDYIQLAGNWFTIDYAYQGNNIALVAAVPEPASLLLLTAGSLCLLRRRGEGARS